MTVFNPRESIKGLSKVCDWIPCIRHLPRPAGLSLHLKTPSSVSSLTQYHAALFAQGHQAFADIGCLSFQWLRLEAHLNVWDGNIGEASDLFNSTRLSFTKLSEKWGVHWKKFTFFHPSRRWYSRHSNLQARAPFVPKASDHSLIKAKKCDRSPPRALSPIKHVVLQWKQRVLGLPWCQYNQTPMIISD